MKPTIAPVIQLASGAVFDFGDIGNSTISIEDIATGLSHMPRFGGQTVRFYSVAQHSCLCAHNAPRHLAYEALMHDAHEALVLDVQTPFKQLLPDYRAIESQVQHHLAVNLFGYSCPTPEYVKVVDLRMLATEVRDLMNPCDHWNAIAEFEPYPEVIHPWSTSTARMIFLRVFNELYPSQHFHGEK